MKKSILFLFFLLIMLSFAAYGETTEHTIESSGNVPVMSYEEYVQAPLDAPVCVETYVQATQEWWDNTITVYAQSRDGAYYIYNMACSKANAAKLVAGKKIRVKGYKAEWAGEIEIVDSTFEFIDGDSYIAKAEDVTALLGTDKLIDKQNKRVAFKGMTVEAYNESGAAFVYKNAEAKTDDLYFKVSKNGQAFQFCVEFYLCGKDTEVYKTVEALKVGDVIDCEGFLYWYCYGNYAPWCNGPNPHITKINKGNVIPSPNLILPRSLKTIESDVFSGIPSGTVIYIPATVTKINENAFGQKIIIVTPFGSYAAQWAEANGFELYEE